MPDKKKGWGGKLAEILKGMDLGGGAAPTAYDVQLANTPMNENRGIFNILENFNRGISQRRVIGKEMREAEEGRQADLAYKKAQTGATESLGLQRQAMANWNNQRGEIETLKAEVSRARTQGELIIAAGNLRAREAELDAKIMQIQNDITRATDEREANMLKMELQWAQLLQKSANDTEQNAIERMNAQARSAYLNSMAREVNPARAAQLLAQKNWLESGVMTGSYGTTGGGFPFDEAMSAIKAAEGQPELQKQLIKVIFKMEPPKTILGSAYEWLKEQLGIEKAPEAEPVVTPNRWQPQGLPQDRQNPLAPAPGAGISIPTPGVKPPAAAPAAAPVSKPPTAQAPVAAPAGPAPRPQPPQAGQVMVTVISDYLTNKTTGQKYPKGARIPMPAETAKKLVAQGFVEIK